MLEETSSWLILLFTWLQNENSTMFIPLPGWKNTTRMIKSIFRFGESQPQIINITFLPAASKGCQLNPKGWWIDTLMAPLWKVQVSISYLHPRNFTWNLKRSPQKRRKGSSSWKPSIFRFHVKLWEGIYHLIVPVLHTSTNETPWKCPRTQKADVPEQPGNSWKPTRPTWMVKSPH